MGACDEAVEWAAKQKDLKTAIRNCKNVCWISWYIWEIRNAFLGMAYDNEIDQKTKWYIGVTGIYKNFRNHYIDLNKEKDFIKTPEYKKLLVTAKATFRKYIQII
jgi:hypothetical protein